jgi:hypothetical protein
VESIVKAVALVPMVWSYFKPQFAQIYCTVCVEGGATARPHPIIAWTAACMRASPATSNPLRATLMEKAGKLASPPALCLAPQPPSPRARKPA